MSLKPANIKDEKVYRVFKRTSVAEGDELTHLEIGDFARRATENGLSMLRVKYFPNPIDAKKYPKFANRKALVGLAVCKVDIILKTGMMFYTSDDKPEHVSLRCTDCNLSKQQGECTPNDEKALCPLYSETSSAELSSWLAEQFDPNYPAKVIPYAD